VSEVEISSQPLRPFPGLRSFETTESLLFFGRETHTEALLQRLSEARFLAIVGASGGGKSSLVKAGLLPALYRGYLTGSTTRWRIAVMRPGSAPLKALARALDEQAALGNEGSCLPLLRATTLGLVQAAEVGGLQPGESLLVVADQFEELFRFHDGQDALEDRQHFVSLLLNAVDRSTPRVYVALTMRYEYLADCSQFPGLPEALNTSQYLIPRLTREQRQAAIEGPLRLAGVRIAPRLVQALLNEAGDDPYQLPVLQHVLLRTFLCWQAAGADGPMDLVHYEKAGRLERALDTHAGQIFESLSHSQRPVAERVFRSLTVTDEDGRVTRRPRRFDYLCDVVGQDGKDVAEVVRRFASPVNSLLLLSRKPAASGSEVDTAPEPETEIDISHESVIARWRLLGEWVKREAFSANRYRDLAQATLAYGSGEGGAWRDPELARTLRLRTTDGWNPTWAGQYWPEKVDPSFEATARFLSRSRWRQNTVRLSIAFVLLLLIAFGINQLRLRRQTYEARLEAARATAAVAKANAAADQVRLEQAAALIKVQAAAEADRRRADDAEVRLKGASSPAERAALEEELKKARADAKRASDQAVSQRAEYEKLRSRPLPAQVGDDDAVLKQKLGAAEATIDDLRKQMALADAALRSAQATRSSGGSISARYEPPLRKPENYAWFEYLAWGQQELKLGRPEQALAYLYTAAALQPKSILDDGSNRNRSFFPHFELARAYAALGQTAVALHEIDLEEQAGVIRKSPAFAQLQELKKRVASGTSSAK
jgi:hypothetical protein